MHACLLLSLPLSLAWAVFQINLKKPKTKKCCFSFASGPLRIPFLCQKHGRSSQRFSHRALGEHASSTLHLTNVPVKGQWQPGIHHFTTSRPEGDEFLSPPKILMYELVLAGSDGASTGSPRSLPQATRA